MAYGLHVRSSVSEVEAACLTNRTRLQSHILNDDERARGMSADYAVDQHFELFAYDAINTVAAVVALAKALDREDGGSDGCAKARGIRSYLQEPFWSEGGERGPRRLRSLLGSNRRIICSGHESGLYARRSR